MAGDGRVYQRGTVWWMDWTDASGKRHRRSLGLEEGAKESKARRALQAFKAEVEAERAVRGSGLLERLGIEAAPSSGAVPLSGLAARWLEALEHRAKPTTVYNHRKMFEGWIYNYFGHQDARMVNAAALDAFRRHVAQTPVRGGKLLKPQSVNWVMNALYQLLRYGEELGLLRAPAALKPLPARAKEPQWWTLEERDHLLEAARVHEPQWWSFLAVAFATGLRRGEMLALRWADVVLTPGEERLHVRRNRTPCGEGTPKGNRARVVFVGALGAAALHEQRAGAKIARLDGEDFVFPSVCHDGKGRALGTPRAALRRLCKTLDIAYRPLHAVRHSYCSHLVELGASPVDVQRLAGHASLGTTQTYFHAHERQLQRAACLLGVPLGTNAAHSGEGGG